MTWYWAGIIAGAVMPFLMMPSTIMAAVRDRGIGIGIAAWSGMLWITVPLMLLIMWIVHLVVA
ncbi:hypothetical protein ACLBYG_19330 [Methylobacterium sp. D53M]|jgi:hypothetical protein